VTFTDTIGYNFEGEEIHQIDIHDVVFFNGKIISVVGKVFSQRSSVVTNNSQTLIGPIGLNNTGSCR
jgi:hypothetical protein